MPMNVKGFQKSFDMDQTDFGVNDQMFQALFNAPWNDPKRQCICTDLSMSWLARLMLEQKEKGTSQQRKDALQSRAGRRLGGKDFQDPISISPFLAAHSLMPIDSKCHFWGAITPSMHGKMAAILTPQHTCCLLSFTLQNVVHHMAASYASGGKLGFMRHLYFFDPNMGEYIIDMKDAESFLFWWLYAYCGHAIGENTLSWFTFFVVQRGATFPKPPPRNEQGYRQLRMEIPLHWR